MLNHYREPYIIREVAPFHVDGLAIPYPEFVPRLYNFCKELGFRKGYIMPSRAFCSDENQGLPIILLTKHFGTFPFNHGRVGGLLSINRNGPHSHHGDDLVIVQASHVGYDPDTGEYGGYRRPQVKGDNRCVSCGKLTHVFTPYLEQYHFARERIFLRRDEDGHHLITAKNTFIDFGSHPVDQGLVLKLSNIVEQDEQRIIRPFSQASTTQTYEVSPAFKKRLDDQGYEWKSNEGKNIGELLTADLFYFKEKFHETDDSLALERSLIEFMPDIVSAKYPPLRAAQANVQLEFSRVVQSIRRGEEYRGRSLLYITGLNIDISEYEGFPTTNYFVPWAAHVQLKDGTPEEYTHPIEQEKLFAKLMSQSMENPDQTDLKENIKRMLKAPHFDIRVR
ncbi:MAG: hypothetical protein KJ804_07415 [Proteobacteria bacterium]|nr:hypothetical protein [Pseudomonadota bacterium]MBU1058128.1 hypothetical protein [Pseudomonadota bacterium]